MKKLKENSRTTVTPRLSVTIIIILGAILPVALVSAPPNSMTRTYVAGAEPLCSLDLPNLPPPEQRCPAISRADNGDTVEVRGSGTFDPRPRMRTVTGDGQFVHKDSSGNVQGQGTWKATRLLGFTSYGTMTLGDGTVIEGGLLLLQVELLVGGNPVFTAILQIDCEVGKVPPGHHEGIRLAVQGTDLNFHEKVQGLTVFIR